MSGATASADALRRAVALAVTRGLIGREAGELVLEQLTAAPDDVVSVAQVGFLLDLDEAVVEGLAREAAAAPPAPDGDAADADALVPEAPSLIGRTIDGFEIHELLGEGGMGRVYRARQQAVHRDVALKVLAASRLGDAEAARRFLREGRAAASLNHPRVVTCHGMGRSGEHLWVAMELVPGGDLEARLRRHPDPMPEARALAILRDAAEGLAALEAAGLVHRDLKPANIFLTPDGRAKLGDLGLACSRTGDDRVTRTGLVVGTPAYMAPEQAEGREPDIRADVYALGATLYRMVTGQPPFAGTELSILRRKLDAPPPDPRAARPQLSPGTARVILRAMARNPADRPASAAALLAEIDAASRALEDRRAAGGPRRAKLVVAALVAAGAMAVAAWRIASHGNVPPGARAAPAVSPPATPAAATTAAPWPPPGSTTALLRPGAGSFAIAQDDGFAIDPGDEDWRRTGFFDTAARQAPVEVTYRIDASATRDAPAGVLAEQGFTHPGGFFFELGVRSENREIDAGAQLEGFALWLTLVVDAAGNAHGLVRAIGPGKPPGRLDAGLPGVALLDQFTLEAAFADGPLDVTVDVIPGKQLFGVFVSRNGRLLADRRGRWDATPLEAGPAEGQALHAWAHAGNWGTGRGRGHLAASAR